MIRVLARWHRPSDGISIPISSRIIITIRHHRHRTNLRDYSPDHSVLTGSPDPSTLDLESNTSLSIEERATLYTYLPIFLMTKYTSTNRFYKSSVDFMELMLARKAIKLLVVPIKLLLYLQLYILICFLSRITSTVPNKCSLMFIENSGYSKYRTANVFYQLHTLLRIIFYAYPSNHIPV